jgi:ankyrin repeat protein
MQSNLNGAYNEIMDRIDGQREEDRVLARRTLSWIAYAKRPLHVSELVEALAIESSIPQIDPDNILDLDLMLSVCAGLVIVDEGDVRLVHYTTQLYLDAVQETAFPNAQMEITSTCMAVKRLQAMFPGCAPALDGYARVFCLIHAHGQPELRITDDILHFLTQACGSTLPYWVSWASRLPSYPSRLCVAAGFNLREIVARLLADEEFDENALTAAIINGHADMVRFLIERGGNVNLALREASREGDEDIVRLLLEKGADINWQQNQFSSALQVASFRGKKQIVSLLIANGADVNLAPQKSGTTLEVTAVHGNYEAVDIRHLHGEPYGTALHAASLGGNTDIASLLIKHGANINAYTERDGTALAAAVSCGSTDVARLLINHGAQISDPGAEGWDILGLASTRGNEEIVRLLLAKGADVNAKSTVNNTALQAASFGGQDTIATLLIQHGADVNATGGQYGTALEIASRLGRTTVVCILLDNGADINQNGGKCIEEASSWGEASSSSWGHKEVVRLLIEHGAVVDRPDGSNSGFLNV